MHQRELKHDLNIRAHHRRRVNFICKALGIRAATTGDRLARILRRVRQRNTLSSQYREICKFLNRHYPNLIDRTNHERWFERRYSRAVGIKFYPQVWIGNICLDLFIPAYGLRRRDHQRGFLRRGLGFEVDGAIHRNEIKMKQDTHKENFIGDLGILLTRVPNEYVGNFSLLSPKVDKRIDRLDSRSRKHVWELIHLTTLIAHASPASLVNLFSEKNREKLKGLI